MSHLFDKGKCLPWQRGSLLLRRSPVPVGTRYESRPSAEVLARGGDKVCHLGRSFDLKLVHHFLQQAIRICDALVLPQMLEPRLYEEGLKHSPILRGVLEYP